MNKLTIAENSGVNDNHLEWVIKLRYDDSASSDSNIRFSIAFEMYLENIRLRIVNALQLNNEDNVETIAADISDFIVRHTIDKGISYNIISYQLAMLFMKVSYYLDMQSPDSRVYEWLYVDNLKENDILFIKENIKTTLLAMFGMVSKKQSKYNSLLIEKCKAYMQENLYNDLSLVNVAEAMAIHPNYLSRIFKEITGMNFIQYMTMLKIKEAKKLLEDSSLRVNEIADKLNYHDNSYFSKKFKNTVGVLPTEYRRLIV